MSTWFTWRTDLDLVFINIAELVRQTDPPRQVQVRKSLHEVPQNEVTECILLSADRRTVCIITRWRHYLIVEIVKLFHLLVFFLWNQNWPSSTPSLIPLGPHHHNTYSNTCWFSATPIWPFEPPQTHKVNVNHEFITMKNQKHLCLHWVCYSQTKFPF